MTNPLQKIEKLINFLPKKDAELCSKYLAKRDFQSIYEIVKSDIYKANKKDTEPDDTYRMLVELEVTLSDYMSYLDFEDDFY